jgi:DNA anti-recombination protein RmuC
VHAHAVIQPTDFAILYLPTEGLYAEVIRRPGLLDNLQRECRIVVAGPTVLLAILNSLRMGFRTLAIQKRSSEIWHLLAAVKTEFGSTAMSSIRCSRNWAKLPARLRKYPVASARSTAS